MRLEAIDMHGHFGTYTSSGKSPLSDGWWTHTAEYVRRRARDVGVILTVVSPLTALLPKGGGDPLKGNEESVRAAGDDPELMFWAVYQPGIEGCAEQVRELLGHPRCAGMKVHPTEHNYEIREKGDEIFGFAAKESALVMTHSGNQGAFPEDYVEFANRYPEVRLILAHLGNDEDQAYTHQIRAIQLCKASNVWVDTSSSRSTYGGLIEWAVREIGAGRLVFGSDTPLYSVASQKARIEFAEIPWDDRIMILRENASALLKKTG